MYQAISALSFPQVLCIFAGGAIASMVAGACVALGWQSVCYFGRWSRYVVAGRRLRLRSPLYLAA